MDDLKKPEKRGELLSAGACSKRDTALCGGAAAPGEGCVWRLPAVRAGRCQAQYYSTFTVIFPLSLDMLILYNLFL
jgi:hypothetical protein